MLNRCINTVRYDVTNVITIANIDKYILLNNWSS